MHVTSADLETAAAQLRRSEADRAAAADLLAFLDGAGLSLDASNQQAVLTILAGAWSGYAGSARDVLRSDVAPSLG